MSANDSNKYAVIYARVSSDRQKEEGYSIDAQLEYLLDYAKQNEYLILDTFIEVESAKQAGRPRLNDMIKFIKQESKKKKDITILVEKVDRLYRNDEDKVAFERIQKVTRLKIKFAKVNLEISNESKSSDILMHDVYAAFSKHQINNSREEVKKGLIRKAQMGIFPNKAPIGYRNEKGIVNGERKNVIVPDPQPAAFVKRLFEVYATGQHSVKSAAQVVYDEGLGYLKHGKKHASSKIDFLLKNPIYYGYFRYHGELIKGIHQPIISKELFDNVQKAFGRFNKSKYEAKFFKLRGLLQCGHCGCAITPYIKKGKYVYYQCTKNNGYCPEHICRESDLETQFIEGLKNLSMTDKMINWVKEFLQVSNKTEVENNLHIIRNLKKEKENLEDEIESFLQEKMNGSINIDEYRRFVNKRRERIADIDYRIENHKRRNDEIIEQYSSLLELVQNIISIYFRRNDEEKSELLKIVYSNSVLRDGEIILRYREPFDLIAVMNARINEKSRQETDENGWISTIHA